jgi:hypothetical protein
MYQQLFVDQQLISRKEDAASNYAKGHHQEIGDLVLGRIESEAAE